MAVDIDDGFVDETEEEAHDEHEEGGEEVLAGHTVSSMHVKVTLLSKI